MPDLTPAQTAQLNHGQLGSTHTDRHGDHWNYFGGYVTRVEFPSVRLPLDEANRAYAPFDPPLIPPPRCASCGAVFRLAMPERMEPLASGESDVD